MTNAMTFAVAAQGAAAAAFQDRLPGRHRNPPRTRACLYCKGNFCKKCFIFETFAYLCSRQLHLILHSC